MLVIYSTTSQNLNAARVENLQLKVATSSGFVPPPPSIRRMRSSGTVIGPTTRCRPGNDIFPDVWGWKKSITGLLPIRMSQPAAPECLISIIRCNCSGKCNKKTCTCCKNGLLCTPASGQFRGITCLNGPSSDN